MQVGYSPTEFDSKCTYRGSCALSQRVQAAAPLINACLLAVTQWDGMASDNRTCVNHGTL